MELFINHVPTKKFTATNEIWNNLRLNAPWSVGYVSYLINVKTFTKKQHWEEFYYQTGNERNYLLQHTAQEQSTIQLLNNELLSYKCPKRIANIPNKFRKLNLYYGRTKKQLVQKGKILYQEAKKKGIEISLEESVLCVKFRVLGETWNGIIGREKNVQACLRKIFRKATFKKTTADFDHKYAVDLELYQQNKLICGLQIKPTSYMGKAPYLQTARKANQKKNEQYQKKFGVVVLNILANVNGAIKNREVMEQVKLLLK